MTHQFCVLVEEDRTDVEPWPGALEPKALEHQVELARDDEGHLVAPTGEFRRDPHIGEDVTSISQRRHHNPCHERTT
jgi:hypothetical protein